MDIKVKARVETSNDIRCTVSSDGSARFRLDTKVDVTKSDLPLYEGAYDVTPNMEKTTLQTKDKLMGSNVVVNAIPVYSVANSSGGNTVTIGGFVSYE